MRKLIMLAMVLGLLVISGIAFANSKLAFRDINLGMLESEARPLIEKYKQEDFDLWVRIEVDQKPSHGKIWLIEVTASYVLGDSLKTAVFKKYGKPTGTRTTNWKTLFGTTYKGIEVWWYIGKDCVTFEYYPSDIVGGELEWQSKLRIMSSEYLASLKKGELKL